MADDPLRSGVVSRADAGRAVSARPGRIRPCLLRAGSHAQRTAGLLSHPQVESLRRGEAAGVLVGGTLTQLTASLGTPYAFDPPPGHILFIDEVAERPYRLDRMLTQLRLSGLLGRAVGVVFGELPRCDEPGGTGPAARRSSPSARGFSRARSSSGCPRVIRPAPA